jgi:protein gp37
MNRTKIEYLDYTWNAIVGCLGVDCAVRDKCWARAVAKRQRKRCSACYSFVPHFHEERLNEPWSLREPKHSVEHIVHPKRVGVCFMSDFFGAQVHPDWQDQVLQIIEERPHIIFIILTKHPDNIPRWMTFPSNLWLGVTVNRKADLHRIATLRKVSAKVRFVSFEPLYEDLGKLNLDGINWIIVGAQTRSLLLPNIEWVTNLFKQAKELSIPVFAKSNLKKLHCEMPQEYPHWVWSYP